MLGETIFTDCEVQTDWPARAADNVILFAEEIDISAADNTVSLTIQLYHKDIDDSGDGTAVGSPITLDGGVSKFKFTQIQGLKQLVRLRLSALIDPSGGADLGWVHHRILAPVWYDTARP